MVNVSILCIVIDHRYDFRDSRELLLLPLFSFRLRYLLIESHVVSVCLTTLFNELLVKRRT